MSRPADSAASRPPGAPDVGLDDARVGAVIDVAVHNVTHAGGPFGALVVGPDGTEVARGGNRVTSSLDPTAHAEVTAIRSACQELGDFSLEGHTLYASCEPCPMCLAACLWARLDRVVFAADRHAAHRAGFDDRAFHGLFRIDLGASWPVRVVHHPHARSEEPFDAWRSLTARVEY
ncbi:nucleoside deaminase [Ornithinimicrobium pekingense]|uniref:tRNA-specific adenosine deaminase n=1 Tax=Ornithinimicrobium pekingense TaxID=384677 RepID=A0ABQ2FAK2_9MICO|nr:nucleoside deaminase [Ornithinimicrobium pekingense]GGK77908.1 tRNA-specific adenosine deaminase [Ornithinimicrobium pekingense]